jgi:hypothetical protein
MAKFVIANMFKNVLPSIITYTVLFGKTRFEKSAYNFNYRKCTVLAFCTDNYYMYGKNVI